MDDTFLRTMLFDFYGDLLTDKQREYYDLHYMSDLSLFEIAEMNGTSRQAVWDIIRRAEQTLRDIEVICVDDGSTDGSPGLLADCASRDARLRIFRQECSGAATARNAGLGIAVGEYIYFCDADDWIDSVALAEMVRLAEESGADIVSSGIRYFDDRTGRETRVWRCGGELRDLPQPISPAAARRSRRASQWLSSSQRTAPGMDGMSAHFSASASVSPSRLRRRERSAAAAARPEATPSMRNERAKFSA